MVAATLIDQPPAISGTLNKINHFVVLMLENRSFDHLLGALKAQNSAVAGALDNGYYNLTDPAVPTSPPVATGPATQFATPFDPGHEFEDVQIQLYGRAASDLEGALNLAAPRMSSDEAPMTLPMPMKNVLIAKLMEVLRVHPSAPPGLYQQANERN